MVVSNEPGETERTRAPLAPKDAASTREYPITKLVLSVYAVDDQLV